MKKKLLILFILIAPSLVWAQPKEFKLSGNSIPTVVAKANGVIIKSSQLENEFISFRLRAQAQGKKISTDEEIVIAREILKAEIMKELISQKARSLGIKITTEKIDLEIKNIEQKFPSNTAFITALGIQRMNIKVLREKIERTLIEDELIRHEIAPKVKLRDKSANNFYKANMKKFARPTLYRTRHILISTIAPSKKLEDEANQKKAQRMAKMINGEAKIKTQEILSKIKAGDDFIQLAKEFSEDETSKLEGGMLGDLHPENTIPEIAAEIVKLKEGETTDIIQSNFGYHILKLDEIIPSTLIPFEKAKSDILNILMKKQTQHLFKEYLIDLESNAKIEIFI